MRITPNVADVSRLPPMLCDQLKLSPDTSITHWRAPWLPRLPSFRFEQRVSGQGQTQRKRELDRRVQEVLLKRVNDPMLHCVIDGMLVRFESHAAAATLRTASENITRVTPLIIMLTPTSVPIAHAELEGHCR
jgi:hypothetical protein